LPSAWPRYSPVPSSICWIRNSSSERLYWRRHILATGAVRPKRPNDRLKTDDRETDRQTLIRDMLDGQYENPVRIVAFNTAEGWSRDVSEDIANDLQDAWSNRAEISASVEEFIQEHATRKMARQLSFAI
jgi:hypothetical protein